MKLTENETKDFVCQKCSQSEIKSEEEKVKDGIIVAEEEKYSFNWPSLGFIDEDDSSEDKFQEWGKIFKPNKSPGLSFSTS